MEWTGLHPQAQPLGALCDHSISTKERTENMTYHAVYRRHGQLSVAHCMNPLCSVCWAM